MALHVEGVEFCVLMSRTTLGSRQATVARYRLLRMRIQSGHTDRPLFMLGRHLTGRNSSLTHFCACVPRQPSWSMRPYLRHLETL